MSAQAKEIAFLKAQERKRLGQAPSAEENEELEGVQFLGPFRKSPAAKGEALLHRRLWQARRRIRP